MKYSIVTGAKGFLGRNLALALKNDQESKIIGIGHGHWTADDFTNYGLQDWFNSNLSLSALDTILSKYGAPDTIYHLAGGSSVASSVNQPLEDFQRTVISTTEVCEWIRSRSPKTQLIYASSAAVYGNSTDTRKEENQPNCKPTSPYGAHKLAAEHIISSYADSYALEATIIRYFSVYGPGLRKQLLWDIAQKAFEKNSTFIELGGTGEEERDWIYVSDAARLAAEIGQRKILYRGVLNGCTGSHIKIREIAQRFLGFLAIDKPVKFTGLSRPGDPRSLVGATELLRGKKFHSVYNIEDGLNKVAEWLIKQRQSDSNANWV